MTILPHLKTMSQYCFKSKKVALLLLLLFFHFGFFAQELYQKAYGNPEDPCIIFLHGGPGYNSASFEISTAETLSGEGYYVIVYDRRGTGRSENVAGEYSFKEAISDLDKILKSYKIKKATLLGHSFGGALAVKFAQARKKKVNKIVLLAAPMNYTATFKSILKKCRNYYAANDTVQLKYMNILDNMDSSKLEYATYSFLHAMNCHLYNTSDTSDHAKGLLKTMAADSAFKFLIKSTYPPVKGFYESEKYTTINLLTDLRSICNDLEVVAIFGDEDGLFDHDQIRSISNAVGKEHSSTIVGASHNVFIDQQPEFIDLIKKCVP